MRWRTEKENPIRKMDHLIRINHMVFIIYFSPFTWGTHHFSAFASSIQFSHKNGTVLINLHIYAGHFFIHISSYDFMFKTWVNQTLIFGSSVGFKIRFIFLNSCLHGLDAPSLNVWTKGWHTLATVKDLSTKAWVLSEHPYDLRRKPLDESTFSWANTNLI